MKWWESNPERFAIEKRLLTQFHPDVKLVIQDGRMRVLKNIVTGKDNYLLEAKFDDHHPYSPMSVYIRKPRLENSPPHSFSDGGLCLHGYNEVGPETTAKIFIDWACQWVKIYEKWLDGESWPVTNRNC